jgi:HAD superfamily hydrolase (TIGR01549 family)
MISAVIFDVDGTLIDSVDLHARAWQETLSRFGCDTSFQLVRDQIGKGGEQLLAVFLPKEKIERQGKQIEQERGELFKREYLPRIKPFASLHELFDRLKADGVKIALGSSAKQDELEIYKRITGIEPFLDAGTSSDDVDKGKPEPDVFLAALDRLGSIKARDVLVVGDTPYDAEAASRAGMQTIGLLCGGCAPEKLLAAGCIALYRDPADLLEKYEDSPIKKSR